MTSPALRLQCSDTKAGYFPSINRVKSRGGRHDGHKNISFHFVHHSHYRGSSFWTKEVPQFLGHLANSSCNTRAWVSKTHPTQNPKSEAPDVSIRGLGARQARTGCLSIMGRLGWSRWKTGSFLRGQRKNLDKQTEWGPFI